MCHCTVIVNNRIFSTEVIDFVNYCQGLLIFPVLKFYNHSHYFRFLGEIVKSFGFYLFQNCAVVILHCILQMFNSFHNVVGLCVGTYEIQMSYMVLFLHQSLLLLHHLNFSCSFIKLNCLT